MRPSGCSCRYHGQIPMGLPVGVRQLFISAMGNVHGEESKGIKVNGRESNNPMGWVEINGGYIEIESVGKGITAGFEADEDGETEDTSDDPDILFSLSTEESLRSTLQVRLMK